MNYIDDVWAQYGEEDSRIIAQAYPIYDLINDLETTSADDYQRRWDDNYEHLYMVAHSNPYASWFQTSQSVIDPSLGLVTWDKVRDSKPHFYFYQLSGCSMARFNVENYQAGWYIFQDSPFGLAAIGSTKDGSMFSFDFFYRSLSANNSFGSALKDWFIQDYYGTDQCWSYGLTLIGDPTLKILPPNVPTITPTPTPSLIMPICQNFRAILSPGYQRINISYDFVGNNNASAKLKVRGWYRELPNGSWKMISEDNLAGNQVETYLGEMPVSRFDWGKRFFVSAGVVAYYDFDNDNSIDVNEPKVACKAGECFGCSAEVPIPRR